MSVRGKTFLGAVVLTLLVVAASAAYLEPRLRDFVEARLTGEVSRDVRAAAAVIELAPEAVRGEAAHAFVRRVAAATGARVTIIAADGRVLADSEVAPGELSTLDDHGSRPEVRAALARGEGTARRHSRTLGEGMIYAAARFAGPSGPAVVRSAVPLTELAEALAQVRVLLLVAGLVGLLAAVLASLVAAQVVTRALRRVLEHARGLERRAAGRVVVRSRDELGVIAGSLNRVAAELEATLSALAIERQRSSALLESMSEAVLAIDADGRVTVANHAAADLLHPAGAPLGRTLLEVVRLPALQELAGAAARGESGEAEVELTGPGPRRALARARPLADGSGVVLVLHDVTELRRLETVRRDFVANVSHELRTPVSVIRANSETLLAGALEDHGRARAFVDAIWRNAERLTTLLADLLDIARIEAGQYRLTIVPVSAATALAAVAEAFRSRAEAKRMVLTVGAVDPALVVAADEGALQQVLANLVDNAVKYTPEGGHVQLDATTDGEDAALVRLRVSDDGPGIEPRHSGRVFERFYRVDPGRSREMGGTGLGLAIVKHLAESMGGEAGLTPASPHGCIFWVDLPRAQARSDAA